MQSKHVQRQENWRYANYRVKTQKDEVRRQDDGGWEKEEKGGRMGKGSCLIAVISSLDEDDSLVFNSSSGDIPLPLRDFAV